MGHFGSFHAMKNVSNLHYSNFQMDQIAISKATDNFFIQGKIRFMMLHAYQTQLIDSYKERMRLEGNEVLRVSP